MLTLIRRELYDHLVYLVILGVISAVLIWIVLYGLFWMAENDLVVGAIAILLPVLLLGYCGLGISQMYVDRANRVSTLLSTLAVTRTRVLAARVLVGAVTILATVIPFAIAAMIVLRLAQPLAGLPLHTVADASVTVALAGFACYCMGLLAGWSTGKAWPLVGGAALLGLAMSLVYIKGVGIEAMTLLLLLIAASLLVTWYRFTSASL